MNNKHVFVALAFLICTGCGIQMQENVAATSTALIITATLPPTQTMPPSSTPLPPPPSPTIAPVSGTTTTSINVRAAPSTASEAIGIIPPNTSIQIVGVDPGESWWQIIYPQNEDGKGWVAAQYISTAIKPEVPVIGGVGTNPENGNLALIQQRINIRSGPGTSFNSIGTLNPQDVVALTGKDENGAWLQIEYVDGPDGRGWVNSAFVQAQSMEGVPIITENGQVIGTGTPTTTALPATPTIVPATLDNDTMDIPIASLNFEPLSTRLFIYSGDVSAPLGDSQDWVGFKTFGTSVDFELRCNPESTVRANILENNLIIWENVRCDDKLILVTVPKNQYLIQISATAPEGTLQYVQYTIKIKVLP